MIKQFTRINNIVVIDDRPHRYRIFLCARKNHKERKCRCDCGKIIYITEARLKSRQPKSCKDCASKLRISMIDAKIVANKIKYMAIKNSDHIWLLSNEQTIFLIQQNCYYCGEGPSNNYRLLESSYRGEFKYNGIDRLDSNKEYTIENCVPCCIICNRMKGNQEYSILLSKVNNIHNRHIITQIKEWEFVNV